MPSQNYARRMVGLNSWQNASSMSADATGSPTLTTTAGRSYLTFSGSGQYLSNMSLTPFSSGMFAFHVLKWTTVGYHNIYDKSGAVVPMLWIDNQGTTGKLELNGGGTVIRSTSAYGDGNWHTIFGWHSSSGTQLWVDNVSQGSNAVNVTPSGTLHRFNRGGAQTFNGSCLNHGFMTQLPNAAERLKLHNSLMALTT